LWCALLRYFEENQGRKCKMVQLLNLKDEKRAEKPMDAIKIVILQKIFGHESTY